MTKKISLALLLIIFIAFAFNVLAQGRELEIKYPEVQGEQPKKTTTQVPDYVKYIFNFLIGIGGVMALGALIYAGFQWFTSAGSPEKIQNAKDQISAALLGLLILFGSYLILTTINPDLVVFKLKRLRPIISELPAGVLVCKEKMEVDRAFQLTIDFPYIKEYEQQKKAKEELDKILDEIALKCYSVMAAGDIIPSFDDKITDIYFIPSKGNPYAVLYGAVLYENSNYEGKSQPIYEHFKNPVAIPVPGKPEQGLKPSSIKLFRLWFPEPHEKRYELALYQEYNRNEGLVPRLDPLGFYLKGTNWYEEEGDLTKSFCPMPGSQMPGSHGGKGFCSPRSIMVGSHFLAILITPDGRSEVFANEIDNNLDDNLNIVNWVKCKEYDSKQTDWRKGCAQPQVKSIVLISADVY